VIPGRAHKVRPPLPDGEIIMCEREMIRFSYEGVSGCVYGGVWVRWAGMGFQIEAAGRGLRRAIDRAITRARQA